MIFTGSGNANKISGIPVASGTPTDTYTLNYNAATNTWVYATNGIPSGGAVGGASSVAATQVLYGASAGVAGSEAAFAYNASTNTLSVDRILSSLSITAGSASNGPERVNAVGAYPGYGIQSTGATADGGKWRLTAHDANRSFMMMAYNDAYNAAAVPIELVRNGGTYTTSVIRLVQDGGNVLLGITADGSYKLDVGASGTNGTLKVKDQLATTGATSVLFDIGAGQTAASTIFTINGIQKFAGTNSTGAGTALLGSNSPAVTNTAPYTWIRIVTSDGSTAFIPAWK